jgi:predicted O-methyltransferase YrrM
MIIDCVPYFNEASLLELRLYELDPVVDLFVVVEADRTHRGDPKPSYLPGDLIRRWAHKLIVHTAALPEGDGPVWWWRREMAQRNGIGEALARLRLNHDDMVLISDCDEIPRRSFVQQLPALPPDGIAVAHQRLSYYTVNHVAPDVLWTGTRATQYGNLAVLGADGVRYVGQERGGFPRRFLVRDAGWHFSYFGGARRVATKIDSFLHQELNTPEVRDEATIAARIAAGEDVYGRDEQHFTIDWAHDLPAAMTERPCQWLEHFHPDYAPTFTERWTNDHQAQLLAQIARAIPPEGRCVEIGSWEGLSTVALAGALGTRPLEAVDTWAGNSDEGADHPTVAAAGARDVYATFARNLRAFGLSNVLPRRMDWRDWAAESGAPLAFVYLDAAHDAVTVAAQIAALRPRLVPGGVLCGDDAYAPGVQQALHGLPGAVSDGRVWWWRNDDGP